MDFEFEGAIWFWKGPSPWYWVTVPPEICAVLHDMSRSLTYGWGMIPGTLRIGKTTWGTSLFPKDDAYIVPIKAAVRKAEKLAEGDIVTLSLRVR